MAKDKRYFEWLNIARGIGIMLVVMGHGIDDTLLYTPRFSELYQFFFDFIYSFHMPLFIFLSGFCCAKILKLKSGQAKEKYCATRFKRLMIPYICVGIAYLIFKMIVSAQPLGSSLINMVMGVNPNYQLWTLYCLFLCAVLLVILSSAISIEGILMGSAIVSVLSCFFGTNILIIDKVLRMFVYFVLGVYFRNQYHDYFVELDKRKRYGVVIAAIILVAVNVIKFSSELDILILITQLTGIALIIMLSMNMEDKHNNIFNKIFNKFGKYSMPIYVFANFFQVLVQEICLERMGINKEICFALSIVMGLVFPMLVAKYIVRKVKIFRIIALGELE